MTEDIIMREFRAKFGPKPELKHPEIVFTRGKDGIHRNPTGLPLDDYMAQRNLFEARSELVGIIQAHSSVDTLGQTEYRTILSEVEPRGGELGQLDQREMKKRKVTTKKEFKDKGLEQASEMLVVFNDLQLPDCDSEALGAALSFVKDNRKRITHFVINGDLSDFKMQSRFPKDLEELAERTQAEIDATDWFLSEVARMLPDAKKLWIQGNHDRPRWENMVKNKDNGVKPWLKTLEEMFDLDKLGYEVIEYGMGVYYKWHDRLFWHGARSGAKSNIGKMELEDAGNISVTTAHINRNAYWESRDALGNLKSGIAHGGFSADNLEFVKKANSGWSLGFGIYYWDKKVGEQPYMVVMRHNEGRFISPDGTLYDGHGFKVGDKI